MRRLMAAVTNVLVAAVVSCTGSKVADELDGFPCAAIRSGSDGECIDWAFATLERSNPGATADAQLVEIDVEPASVNCRFGGTKVTTGPDANPNQSLDNGEITRTRYICTNESELLGAAGRDERTSLAVTAAEPAGSNCVDGGIRVDEGRDVDHSGALGALEIRRTLFLCQAHCHPQNDRVVVPATATGSLDYSSGATDSAMVPTTTASSDVVAWMGFDLGDALTNRAVVGARLFIRHLQRADSVIGHPVLRVVHSAGIPRSVDDLTIARMPRGAFLSNRISNIVRDGWSEIPLLLDSGVLDMVSSHRRLSLGLDEVTIPTQRAAFHGGSDPSTRPYLEFETVRCSPSE